jgi:hypothetical protein
MEGKGGNRLRPVRLEESYQGGAGRSHAAPIQACKKSGPISGATLEKRRLRKVSGKAIESPDQPAGVAQREVMSSAACEGDWFGGLFHCLKEGAFAAPKIAILRRLCFRHANSLPRFHFYDLRPDRGPAGSSGRRAKDCRFLHIPSRHLASLVPGDYGWNRSMSDLQPFVTCLAKNDRAATDRLPSARSFSAAWRRCCNDSGISRPT